MSKIVEKFVWVRMFEYLHAPKTGERMAHRTADWEVVRVESWFEDEEQTRRISRQIWQTGNDCDLDDREVAAWGPELAPPEDSP